MLQWYVVTTGRTLQPWKRINKTQYLLLNLDQHLQQSQQVMKCMHRITILPRSLAFVINSKTAILTNCTVYQTMCVLFLLHNFKFKFFSSDKYLADNAFGCEQKRMQVSMYVICYWCHISPRTAICRQVSEKLWKSSFMQFYSAIIKFFTNGLTSEEDNQCIFATVVENSPKATRPQGAYDSPQS